MENSNFDTTDIQNDIEVKSDLLTLQTNIQISTYEIKHEIAHVDVKNHYFVDKKTS